MGCPCEKITSEACWNCKPKPANLSQGKSAFDRFFEDQRADLYCSEHEMAVDVWNAAIEAARTAVKTINPTRRMIIDAELRGLLDDTYTT